jgi:hypothetical protein
MQNGGAGVMGEGGKGVEEAEPEFGRRNGQQHQAAGQASARERMSRGPRNQEAAKEAESGALGRDTVAGGGPRGQIRKGWKARPGRANS